MEMGTTILTVMVGLAALGFGVLGMMWRSLDNRMDRLEAQRESDRTRGDERHSEIMGELRSHGERIAHLEGREEAMAAG